MFSRIVLALFGVTLLVGPVGASAQWDYLFEDLSWTAEGTIGGGGDLSVVEKGTDGTVSDSSFYDYLFQDLSWPEENFSTDSADWSVNTGEPRTSEVSGSFFDFLFIDLEWPDGTLSGLGEPTGEE